MKTITICAHNRPDYLEQVLESLSVALVYCPEYAPDVILIGIDPDVDGKGDKDVIALAECFSKAHHLAATYFVWPEHLGVTEHPRRLLQWVFHEMESNFNLHLEDDTVLSPDALRLAEWFYSHAPTGYRCISLHNRSVDYDDPHGVVSRPDFGVWGWACHKHFWHWWMASTWNHKREGKLGWDWSMSETVKRNALTVLCPVLSRVHNIGRSRGAHQTEEGYDEEMKGLVWAGQEHMTKINQFAQR